MQTRSLSGHRSCQCFVQNKSIWVMFNNLAAVCRYAGLLEDGILVKLVRVLQLLALLWDFCLTTVP